MHDAALYGDWGSIRAGWPHRSYLYALPPIGIGTAAAESLTGYISRLAAAHSLETGVLVNHELLPRIPYTKGISAGQVRAKLPCSFYIDAHSLNGIGDCSRLWVSLLEQLTCIQRLDLLTALPWAHVISCVHLLRTTRAWCPHCYGVEGSSSVYERLLWTFQIVTVCPMHRCSLDSICPSCGRTQYVFSSKSRTGYCSRCQCWLGSKPQSRPFDNALSEQIRIAEMVGELMAASPSLPAGFGLDRFRENVRKVVRDARSRICFPGATRYRGWTNHRNAPRMDSLVVMSCTHNISMVRLLAERISSTDDADAKHSRYAHCRVPDRAVEEALRAALRDDIPPSLTEIAIHLGYRTDGPLKSRYRALCGDILNKRRCALKGSRTPSGTPVARQHIENALMEALKKNAMTSLGAVAASIGLRNKRRLYKSFHDLRRAVVSKNKRIRKQYVDAIENALRAAFDEKPIPTVTEVARRLQLRDVTRITRRFPNLSAELKYRRQGESRGVSPA
ncbi:MAG: TniQ family protein [Acidobacteria bacterium]|nr:TniQ family protein [Acidobacteriota bacterium]